MADAEVSRCGFVALVGAPNAGKSTLLNALVGAKLSIVTPKVQTTRTRIRGVATEGTTQIIFVDTPGIFTPKRRLERAMVAAAWAGAADADLVVVVVDAAAMAATGEPDADTLSIVEGLRKAGRKAVLALNKVDLVKPPVLLGIVERLNREGIFSDVFMISALTGSGVADLRAHLARHLPEGPWLYPADQLTDMPERLLAAEVTREQLFLQLHQELPYALTVETESWEEFADGSVKITQVIYVERDNQKAIVLGKGGQRIKAVGAAARKELAAMLGRPVHLFLYVKVRERWREDRERYRVWDLDFDA
jgi:GTP-binding protein Era